MSNTYNYTIQETDLDFLGHVNNATYIKIFEQARWHLIHEKGLSFKKINQLQQSPIVLSIDIKYLKELTARQIIEIKTEFLAHDNKIGQLKQSMTIQGTGIIACTALVGYGIFDMKLRKLIEPTGDWLELINS